MLLVVAPMIAPTELVMIWLCSVPLTTPLTMGTGCVGNWIGSLLEVVTLVRLPIGTGIALAGGPLNRGILAEGGPPPPAPVAPGVLPLAPAPVRLGGAMAGWVMAATAAAAMLLTLEELLTPPAAPLIDIGTGCCGSRGWKFGAEPAPPVVLQLLKLKTE